jgi:signal transduction histidine kinase
MADRWFPDYREAMTSAGTSAREPGIRVTAARGRAVLRSLVSARTGRAAWDAVTALGLMLAGLLTISLVVLLWGAASWSLFTGPDNRWRLTMMYVLVTVGGPIPVLWTVQGFATLQRLRLYQVLGVEIPRPKRRTGLGPWPIGPWRSIVTWRAVKYHVVNLVVGGVAAALVLLCFAAPALAIGCTVTSGRPLTALAIVPAMGLLLAAPRAARTMADLDERLGHALLGPSHDEILTEQVETLARSRAEILATTDAERRRIERDLHDGAQQRLVSLAMNLGLARVRFQDGQAGQAIAEAHEEALLALTEMRDFIRGLHPAVLSDRGLDAALSGIVARAALPVRLSVDVPERVAPSIEAVAYFLVSEALTNIAKHAQATSAEVTAVRTGDRLRITIMDNGRGGASAGRQNASGGHGSGLRGLAQRAAAVDGVFIVDSPVGGPTVLTAELPCAS